MPRSRFHQGRRTERDTKEELQDKLNAAYEDVDRLLKQQDAHDEEMAQLEGKIESMKEDFECLKADRDVLRDYYDSQVKTAEGFLDSYRLERKRAEKLEQKLTYTQTQAEAYLAYILILKQSLTDQGEK